MPSFKNPMSLEFFGKPFKLTPAQTEAPPLLSYARPGMNDADNEKLRRMLNETVSEREAADMQIRELNTQVEKLNTELRFQKTTRQALFELEVWLLRRMDELETQVQAASANGDTRLNFTIKLQKLAGERLGLGLSENASGLFIKAVLADGLVADWNRKNEGLEVKTHDRLLKVNGVCINSLHDYDQAAQSAAQVDGLELTIQRRCHSIQASTKISGKISTASDCSLSTPSLGAELRRPRACSESVLLSQPRSDAAPTRVQSFSSIMSNMKSSWIEPPADIGKDTATCQACGQKFPLEAELIEAHARECQRHRRPTTEFFFIGETKEVPLEIPWLE